MPKYTFKCSNCSNEMQMFVSVKTKTFACKDCGMSMDRKLPKLSGQADVNETIDDYTGIVHRADQREIVEQRRNEYYWSVEVPRMVNSGTYSVQTMLDMGWIYLDEKNQIQIHTKPPHRR